MNIPVEDKLDMNYRYAVTDMGANAVTLVQLTHGKRQAVFVISIDAYLDMVQRYPDKVQH